MAWRVFEKLKEKFTGKPAETPAATQAPPKPGKPEQPELSEGTGLKELEKKGLLGQFYRHWKNPAFLRQVQAIAGRMKADGVDLKDQKAVQVWVQAHQKEIESGAPSAAAAKPQTYVKTGPEPGRNDPCPCGSGRKHKKCCGTSK